MDKTSKKAERRGKKKKEEEEDIDLIVQRLQAIETAKVAVTVQIVPEPPAPRINASLSTHPTNHNELILFGGESCDERGKAVFYNQLYRAVITATGITWRLITSPNSPAPRSSHQAATTTSGHMFVFGGEYGSASQQQFHHFRDLWRLDLGTNEWEKIELKGGPSARSGHRMISWNGRLWMFGGFFEAKQTTKYHGDLWVYIIEDQRWEEVKLPSGALCPSPRSGFSFFLPEGSSVAYVYGGVSRRRMFGSTTVHQDLWALHLNQTLNAVRWERVKMAAAGGPGLRCSVAMITHKGHALSFGGVTDVDTSEEELRSTYHDDLWGLALERRRWYPMAIRQQGAAPCARSNASLAVIGHDLYVYGGMREIGSGEAQKEMLHNDLWRLDLSKMKEWECVVKGVDLDWEESSSEEDDEDEDGEEEAASGSGGGQSEIRTERKSRSVHGRAAPSGEDDRTPFAGEALAAFFQRTQSHWVTVAEASTDDARSKKALREQGFNFAREAWTKMKEEPEYDLSSSED